MVNTSQFIGARGLGPTSNPIGDEPEKSNPQSDPSGWQPIQPMKTQPIRHRTPRKSKGFALIVTLTLMVLLTVLALGILSLSTISLRSSAQGDANAVARANARLALSLAIGDLQVSMGPDQRVSAPAGAVMDGAGRPNLTGAWNSWRWAPSATGAPSYADKAKGFHRWLVSTPNPVDAMNPGLASAKGVASDILVVGKKGLTDEVRVQALPVSNGKLGGSSAWAVFDESAKASIDLDPLPKNPTAFVEIAGRNGATRPRADVLDPNLAFLKTPQNLVSLKTASIPGGSTGGAEVEKRFHDFTTGSTGLLSDVGAGGLKLDLTSALEAASLPSSVGTDSPYLNSAAGAPRWSYLRDHYQRYRETSTLTGGVTGVPLYKPNPTKDLQPQPAPDDYGFADPAPSRERLLPIIAKLQIMFSVVSHNAHIGSRVQWLNTSGDPKGNDHHAVIHLAYDPVVTLYNPYDVKLELKNYRVRIFDPPVGFRFKKNGVNFRDSGPDFQGLGNFQIKNERAFNSVAARRYFTLILSDGTPDKVGNSLTLLPGEVKVFSPRVEKNWTWGLETSGGDYSPRGFFDWNADSNFGNIDKRTDNPYGVEAVPGWDTRAGLQTDHLSFAARPANTLYDFEKQPGAQVGGFLSMRCDAGLAEKVTVEARPELTNGNQSTVPDLRVDLLAGRNTAPESDILRSYSFKFSNVVDELSEYPANPIISRTFEVADTLQAVGDQTSSRKKPFALLEMSARTTHDPLDDTKPWLFNNPVTEGGKQDSSVAGSANQAYDVRLREVSSFNGFPNGIAIDSQNRGYYGPSKTAAGGCTNVPMFHIPVTPASSLGDWVASNLIVGSRLPRVTHPLGNSRAHPLISSAKVSATSGGSIIYDHSYFLNYSLWDRYYFSTITNYVGTSPDRTRKTVLEDLLSGKTPALNANLAPVSAIGDATRLASDLDSLSDADRTKRLATVLGIRCAFNVNSTSVDAWRAVLSSFRDRAVNGWSKQQLANADRSPLVRFSFPLAGAAETNTGSADVQGQVRWAGFRSLDDASISKLADAIVAEIRKTGVKDKAPLLTLGEFVNRRIGLASDLHVLGGLLQTAIDNSGVNNYYHGLDSRAITSSSISTVRKLGALNTQAMDGNTAEGAPSILSQGDLMAALAPIATVRGDTFRIRAYGESKDAKGSVLARAWCEAVVQRIPDYVDRRDNADSAPSSGTVNATFGRRFNIVSFRWLSPTEI